MAERRPADVFTRIEWIAWAVMAIAIVIVLASWLVLGETTGPVGGVALIVAVVAALAAGALRARPRR